MLFGTKKVLGVDIGTSSIKIAELDVSRKGAKLNRFTMVQTPDSSVAGGEIIDTQPVVSALAHALKMSKSSRKNASTGLWGSSVIVKKISIPKMEEKLIAEQVRWEAEQYIPFDLSEVNLDYAKLKSPHSPKDIMDILIVAARHDQIFKLVEIVETAGLNCTHLDVNGFALANTYMANYGPTEGEMVALLNVGAFYTNFVVLHETDIIFCRDIPVGGAIYSADIQKGMSLSNLEAESMKLSIGAGQGVPEDVVSIIESTHEIFCDEILGSFDFFINTTPGAKISRCYITGGGSRAHGLLAYLGKTMNVPCDMLNPFINITSNPKQFSITYLDQIKEFASVAIGLGLRAVGD